jgi:hypothetical protein
MPGPSYLSDPHVQYLYQLIEDLENGLIQIPRFQRPLVWDVDQRLELLRSVRDQIPFGSILLWRTKNSDMRCYDQMGPYKLPPPVEGEIRHYILDGVQRLSVLYAALHSPTEGMKGLTLEFHYDLKKEEFSFGRLGSWHKSRPEMLPLKILLNSIAMARFQRNLTGDTADLWLARADRLAKTFGEYKVPVIPISTEDLDLATRTFQRINTQGETMSELHMVHALTFSKTFALQEEIQDLRRDVFSPLGWEKIDSNWILQACKAALGLDIYDAKAQELSTELKSNPKIVGVVVNNMERSIHFLREECGVPSPALVPYAYQAILLAEAFRLAPEPSSDLRDLLRTWFWLTTLGEAFAGISGYRLRRVVSNVQDMVKSGRSHWSFSRSFQYRELPAKSTFRSVRFKALALRLASRQGDEGAQILANHNAEALGHVVSRPDIGTLFAHPGNRLVSDPGKLRSLREQLIAPDADQRLLDQHLISEEAHSHLQAGENQLFVETRYEELKSDEEEFARSLEERWREKESTLEYLKREHLRLKEELNK